MDASPVHLMSVLLQLLLLFNQNLARRQVHFHELSDGMADAKSGVDVDDPAYLKAKIKELVGILRPLMAVTQKREGGAADA